MVLKSMTNRPEGATVWTGVQVLISGEDTVPLGVAGGLLVPVVYPGHHGIDLARGHPFGNSQALTPPHRSCHCLRNLGQCRWLT